MPLETRDAEHQWFAYLIDEMVRRRDLRSQRAVAEATGLSPSVVNALRTGNRGASEATRTRLAEYIMGYDGARRLRALLRQAPPPPDDATLKAIRRLLVECNKLWPSLTVPARGRRTSRAPALPSEGRQQPRGLADRDLLDAVLAHVEEAGAGTVIVEPTIHVGDVVVRPGLYLPDQRLIIEARTGLGFRPQRLYETIGQAAVFAGLLGARAVIVTDTVPMEELQRMAGAANIGIAWLNGDRIEGLDLDRSLGGEGRL